MQKLLTTLLLLASLALPAYAQDAKEKNLSEADKFSAKSGTLIEKQFVDVGKVKAVQVKILKLKDLNEGSSKSALRLEYEYVGTRSSDTKIASLDADEIDGLIKSIKNLQTNVFTSSPKEYTEVTFRSRTGFEAGAYYDSAKAKWSCYMKLERFDNNSMVFLAVEDFSAFLALIEQAKSKM